MATVRLVSAKSASSRAKGKDIPAENEESPDKAQGQD